MGTTPSTASAKSSSIRITTPPRLPPTPAYLRGMDTTYYRGSTSSGRASPKSSRRHCAGPSPSTPTTFTAQATSSAHRVTATARLLQECQRDLSEPEPEDDNYITYIRQKEARETPVQTLERALDCDIFCTPAMRQGYTLDFEATTSSAFYALRPTVSYLNRNLFRGAELLNISLSGGYEFNTDETAAKNSLRGGAHGIVTPAVPRPLPH